MSKSSKNSSFVFKQEEEWKHQLAQEVENLQRKIVEKEEKISEQRVQLEELKNSFLYNYDLLKSRDTELNNYESTLVKLQTTLTKRETEISETRLSLAATKEDLVKSQQESVDWRARYEAEVRRSIAAEAEVRRSSAAALAKVTESEAAERRRLQAELTRLQADLEAERGHAAAELDSAVAEAGRRASEAVADAERARLVAEVRADAAEEAAARARLEAQRAAAELTAANEALAKCESEVAAKNQALILAEEKLTEAKDACLKLEKSQAAGELKYTRMSSRWEAEKADLMKEIEQLKDSEKNLKIEVFALNHTLSETREEAEGEHHRLLAALGAAEKAATQNAEALDAVEVERQMALKNVRALEAENRRLRGDLNRALANGSAMVHPRGRHKSEETCRDPQIRDLLAQVLSLQMACSKMQEENKLLRNQATKTVDVTALEHQLDCATMEIERLANENTKLLQLSNKMRARQIREVESLGRPMPLSRRRVESPKGVMSPRGGDVMSFQTSPSEEIGEEEINAESYKPIGTTHRDRNNNDDHNVRENKEQ